MSPRFQFNAALDPAIVAGMKAVKKRDGMPISEQVRRALKDWLKTKGVTETETETETERPRASTRRRS